MNNLFAKLFVIFFVLIGAGELLCRLISPANIIKDYKASLSFHSLTNNGHEASKDVVNNLTTLGKAWRTPHPFFGFVYQANNNISLVNKFGFKNNGEFIKKDKDKLIIGIFGGSVAEEFADWQRKKKVNNEKHLAKRIQSKFKGKEIIINNFALGAGRQPQQFIISTFFTDYFDIAINIEGFNEVNRTDGKKFPSFYPAYSDLLFTDGPQRYNYIFKLYQNTEKKIMTTQFILNSNLLNKSSFVYFLWKSYSKYLESNILDSYSGYKKSKYNNNFYQNNESIFKNHITLSKEWASVWTNFTIKQHKYLTSMKIPSLYFIQPNQYIKNSKLLSAEEQKLYYNPSTEKLMIQSGYDEIIDFIKKNKQINIYDLTMIFSSNPETLYSDDCCHYNKKGYNILEDHITKHLLNSFNSY